MAAFISDHSESYESELPETAFYPALKLSEFQSLFHFLSDETEAAILHNAIIERIGVHRELKSIANVITFHREVDPHFERRCHHRNRWDLHREPVTEPEKYDDLAAFSLAKFGDETTAEYLYKQAVFCKTAAVLIGNRLATDATEEAVDRDEVLQVRVNNLVNNYRNAIDQLLPIDSGYTFEVI